MNRKERRAAQTRLEDTARRQRRAVAREPDNAQAHNELACVLLQQGALDEAAAHFARAVMLMPFVSTTCRNSDPLFSCK